MFPTLGERLIKTKPKFSFSFCLQYKDTHFMCIHAVKHIKSLPV